MDGELSCGRSPGDGSPGCSTDQSQLAALDPPLPDVEGAGVEEVVEDDELSFDDDDEGELSLADEAPSDAVALLRLSVR